MGSQTVAQQTTNAMQVLQICTEDQKQSISHMSRVTS